MINEVKSFDLNLLHKININKKLIMTVRKKQGRSVRVLSDF